MSQVRYLPPLPSQANRAIVCVTRRYSPLSSCTSITGTWTVPTCSIYVIRLSQIGSITTPTYPLNLTCWPFENSGFVNGFFMAALLTNCALDQVELSRKNDRGGFRLGKLVCVSFCRSGDFVCCWRRFRVAFFGEEKAPA